MLVFRIVAGILSAGFLLCGPGALAQDSSASGRGLKLTSKEPIQIDSQKLVVDEAKAMATFTGEVNVVQGETHLKAAKMVVFYKQANKPDGSAPGLPGAGSTTIDRMEVEGKVSIRSGKQLGTGDSGTYDVEKNTLTLSGKEVVLTDGPNQTKGCKLTVDMNTNKSSVDACGNGRVIVNINPPAGGAQPNSAQ